MKFEQTEVLNFCGAFRGIQNALSSCYQSDSRFGKEIAIGKKDLKLAQTLINIGHEPRKFLRQIFICVDITASRDWWSEFAIYKIGTASNSRFIAYNLCAGPITRDQFERTDDEPERHLDNVISCLENLRRAYIKTKDPDLLEKFKQSLPNSILLKRTVTMHYETLYNIVHQLQNPKLLDWALELLEWAMTLPYAKELIFFDLYSKEENRSASSGESSKALSDQSRD